MQSQTTCIRSTGSLQRNEWRLAGWLTDVVDNGVYGNVLMTAMTEVTCACISFNLDGIFDHEDKSIEIRRVVCGRIEMIELHKIE